MKPIRQQIDRNNAKVAPLAGAWIETPTTPAVEAPKDVAPLAGAWIETIKQIFVSQPPTVAPLAGAWIETYLVFDLLRVVLSRSPRGSVD